MNVRLTDFFSKGHERSLRAKKNIVASFLIKGLSICSALLLVPLSIHYLDPTKYGVWITLSSMVAWFGFFDIGLGHGLRNRFAESLATDKNELARIYVSTTYALLCGIIACVLTLFYIVNPFLDWNVILNVTQDTVVHQELQLLALIVFTFFCLSFVFKLITTILTADQRPALASFFHLCGQVTALCIIYVLFRTTEGSLLYLGTAMSSAPVIILVLSSLWFFTGKYKHYRPSLKYVDFRYAKDLFSLGLKFFIIQIAAVLLYQTNNIIISHLFGPAQVTPYNIAFKYFSVLMMGFSIVITPFWSAITEAWAMQETAWIRNIIHKLTRLWILLVVTGIAMLSVSPWVYKAWIGDSVVIHYSISVLVMLWVLMNAWNGIYSHFLNGLGIVKLQLYLGISAAIINVPLAIYLGILFGIEGVLLANILVGVVGSFLYPLQYRMLITGKARGIWNA